MNNEIKLLECLWVMCDVNQDIDVAGYNIEFGSKYEAKNVYRCSLSTEVKGDVYVVYSRLVNIDDTIEFINTTIHELLDFFNKHKKEILTNIDEYNDNNDIDFERTRI